MSTLLRIFHCRAMTEGVDWLKKNRNDERFSGFNLKLTRMVEGERPMFANMGPDVLYKPLKLNCPAVDMMLRTNKAWCAGCRSPGGIVLREISKGVRSTSGWNRSAGWTTWRRSGSL